MIEKAAPLIYRYCMFITYYCSLFIDFPLIKSHVSYSQEHMIQSEVSILRRVKHPNIVLLIEEMDTYNELYLVMELVKVLHIYWCLRDVKP